MASRADNIASSLSLANFSKATELKKRIHFAMIGLDLCLSEEQIEDIADRVIRKLSAEVIEGVACDVVPDIAERVVREELKRQGAG